MLKHVVKSAGWTFGIIILAISISLVALIVLLAMDLRMDAAIPPAFVEEFTDTVNKRQFKEAFDMAKDDPSFLARVLTAGMSRLQYGIEDAREAAFNMVESIKAGKEQLITYLATIGTLGPLLGLVGTVFGMILAFMELAPARHARRRPASWPTASRTPWSSRCSASACRCRPSSSTRSSEPPHPHLAWTSRNIADDLLTQMYHNSKQTARPAAPSRMRWRQRL